MVGEEPINKVQIRETSGTTVSLDCHDPSLHTLGVLPGDGLSLVQGRRKDVGLVFESLQDRELQSVAEMITDFSIILDFIVLVLQILDVYPGSRFSPFQIQG